MVKKQDILSHVWVPQHVILSPEERREVLRRFGVRPEQLPWLKSSDPVARAIGAKPSDIVKIIRKSPTAGEAVVYRFVVP